MTQNHLELSITHPKLSRSRGRKIQLSMIMMTIKIFIQGKQEWFYTDFSYIIRKILKLKIDINATYSSYDID
jgi:hypothetical protein